MTRLSVFLVAALACGCTNADIPAPLRSQQQADAQTVAACRERANQVIGFHRRHRFPLASMGE